MANEKIINLINELQRYDNPKGYKMGYKNVKEKLEPSIKELIIIGEEALDELHKLLEHEERWSCLFALETLKEIKSEKSVYHLINHIVKTEKGDFGDSGEDAMLALTNIGEPAINPILKEIKNQFGKKAFYFYLVGALTEIKSEKVYKFMKEITEDYIKDEEKYDEWFHIDAFISDFDKQGKKEILPLLEKLSGLDRISKHKRIEIKDTINILEDPEEWERKLEESRERAKPLIEELMIGNEERPYEKLSKKEQEKIQELMKTPDNDFELQFKCYECNKKQNAKPGLVWDYGTGKDFSFESEIMCKFCFSNNIKLTKEGERDIIWKAMRVYLGRDKGIMYVGKEIIVENKKMPFNKSYSYIMKRIKEEPDNGELYLRAGNIAEKANKYEEAIKYYGESIKLNPKLIAAYLNLVEIYEFRYFHYKIEDARQTAIFYLEGMMDIFRTQDFNTVTIKNKNDILQFIGEKSEVLGVGFPELIKVPISHYKKEKVGRNEPCPCGSGKKYKKCCLDKERK